MHPRRKETPCPTQPHPDQQQIGSLGALVVTVAFMVCLWASVGIFSLLSRWTIDALVRPRKRRIVTDATTKKYPYFS